LRAPIPPDDPVMTVSGARTYSRGNR